jgi:putative ABC transport system substrate-binding protein
VKRRELVTLLGAAAVACPLVARAQERPKNGVRRIGWLGQLAQSHPIQGPLFTEFKIALEHLGWTEGRNLRIDYRWYGDDADRARAIAKELVSLAPDVVLVLGTTALAAVRQETQTIIPIVFMLISDPVGRGLVASLAHPGGNITGFTDWDSTMGSKFLELLKEIAPGLARVAVIFNPKTIIAPATYNESVLGSIEAAAPSFAVKVTAARVHDVPEMERAITVAGREPNSGLIVLPDVFTTAHSELITALAAQHRLPAVYPLRLFVRSGGLLSYSVDFFEQFRQVVVYIDRILKGAKPADLPVQQPTKFHLFINLKTAKELGITVPPTLLVQADEVIE